MAEMKIEVKAEKLSEIKTDLLAVGLFENEKPKGELRQLDAQLNTEISNLIKAKQFKGEFKECQKISTLGKTGATNILLIGLGKKNKFDCEQLRKLGALVVGAVNSLKLKRFASTLPTAEVKRKGISEKVQAYVEGSVLGLYKFTKYKKKDKKNPKIEIEEMSIVVPARAKARASKIAKKAQLIANSVTYCRNLVNEAPSVATPSYLAAEAKELEKLGVKVTVFGKNEIKKKGMGALYAVASGSSQEPRFIVMQYRTSQKYKIALVGKGITFDAGGLNLKPTNYIEEMKQDMAGAASVIAAMKAIAQLKPRIGVVGVVPACENLVGERAYKPGDILKAYNGKTIEVHNTDAEGRLVLADALSYVEKNVKPKAVIDIATLTGACVVCLGSICTALIGNNRAVKANIKRASEETGERVWELPLYDEFREVMDGEIGDVRNVGKGKGYEAGTITAGAFLEKFVGKVPWCHLDIAGTAWWDAGKDYSPAAGATGVPVRLLINMIENWKK